MESCFRYPRKHAAVLFGDLNVRPLIVLGTIKVDRA
jgi:hypothetical protein